MLSLERHHGVRAGRRRLRGAHGRVWKVARERHESARGVVEADTTSREHLLPVKWRSLAGSTASFQGGA